jgi:hypothetical protein
VVSSRYLLGCLVGRKVKWRLLFDARNTCIRVTTIIFMQSSSPRHYKWFMWTNPREMQYLHFFHLSIAMGKWWVSRTNDQANIYGWVVFGRYLFGWLISTKIKGWHNHLHDEMQFFHQISSFDGATWIIIPTFGFVSISSRLCGV